MKADRLILQRHPQAIDYAWPNVAKSYIVFANCTNCNAFVTVRLAFGQKKLGGLTDAGPECPTCGCTTLRPGSIAEVTS